MGANLPKHLMESPLDGILAAANLTRIHHGKVRDTYLLPDHPDYLFLVATDRLSIFDFVLHSTVPYKGEVLTALTVFWLTEVLQGIEHHLVAFGSDITKYLPESLANNADLKRRAMVVKKLDMLPVECVVRGYLTGSGWSAYRDSGVVSGHKLAEGLHDGSKLPAPIFTPTTKAEVGHDEHISFEQVREEFGMGPEEKALDIFRQIHDFSAEKGIILADTKFELGKGLILGDEVATPDSSRFWDRREWEVAVSEKHSPSGYDKQPVREWGKTIDTPFDIKGINKLDTENTDHLTFVHDLPVPGHVIDATTQRYLRIFELLTGQSLAQFQKGKMAIK